MIDNILKYNMYVACFIVWTLISLFLLKKRKLKTKTSNSNNNIIIFSCLLFTSGLDIGLLLFPLTEFHTYTKSEFLSINPVSIELGFWGFSVWGFYFLATYYFIFIEPKINLFEIKLVKICFTILIVLTCAFSVNLFVNFFIYYQVNIFGRAIFSRNIIILQSVVIIIIAYLLSKSGFLLKLISSVSVFLFIFTVILGYIGIFEANDSLKLVNIMYSGTLGYFVNFNKFLLPMNDYHSFYLFWWFSWALMVGKFTAQFTPNNLTVSKLFLVMIFLPSVPLVFWFSILYFYSLNPDLIKEYLLYTMFIVGVIFLVNSLSAIFNIVSDMIKSFVNYRLTKFSGVFSCILMILFFILYSVKSEDVSLLKIDYTGTIAILFLYLILIRLIYKYIFQKIMSVCNEKN